VYKIAVTVTTVSSTVTVSGGYTLNFNSAIPQKGVAIEAYSTQAAAGTDLISRADANTVTETWLLQVPIGQAVWFRVAVIDDTGYSFGRVVSASAQSYTTDTSDLSFTLGPFVRPELKTFILLNASAQAGAKLDKTGGINQSTGVITIPANSFTTVSVNTIIDFHNLIANFTLSEGSKLYVGNEEQKSGVTGNNYYETVTFTVAAEDNARKTYTVAGRASDGSVVGATSWQTQGFGVMNITTTDKTLGLPVGTTGKLNIVWNPTGTFTYISPEGRVVTGGTEIKVHGNWSARGETNKSYTIKLNERTGFDYYDYKTQKYITLPAHKRWTLLANHSESSRIKGSLGFETGRRVLDKMGWQPHADWVFFFLNGEYKGVYMLVEVAKVDEGRLNIGPEASASTPNGGWIVEMNNYAWYYNDIPNQPLSRNQIVFDDMYNFMTSHQNPVNNSNAILEEIKQQGVLWSYKSPDTDLGWYYPDPPLGVGNLTYSDDAYFPRKAIVLSAKLSNGTQYNRASTSPAEWTVPNDFGQTNGMGTAGMLLTGSLGQNNGGIAGTRTLSQVYPGWQSSFFVKTAKFIQDAEYAVYSHNYGTNGVGDCYDYIDIDSFIDWHIAHELFSDWENIVLNGKSMYYDPSIGKLKMGPLWDLDNNTWVPGVRDA
jgi:hypothetical protein